MLARPFILQAEMLARICPRIASLSENIRQRPLVEWILDW
jgi:hypothetical protein